MTGQPSVEGLIARLESASGPDPHLDAEIEALVRGGVPAYRCSDNTRRSYGPSAVFTRDDGSNILGGDWYSAPSLTGSLDAAVSLVPKGMSIDIHIGPSGMGNEAIIYAPVKSTDALGRRVTTFVPHEAKAARDGVIYWTPAPVQVCIAALRARQTAPQTVDRTPGSLSNTESTTNNNSSSGSATGSAGE